MRARRHPGVLIAVLLCCGCTDPRSLMVVEADHCCECHGDPDRSDCAPPPAKWRDSNRIDAHRSHLDASGWHAAVRCEDCHRVPEEVAAIGHLDSMLPAELTWGPRARAGGVEPAYTDGTCSTVYCHGATLRGGMNDSPRWTTVDGTQAACGTCHGVPPGGGHVQRTVCTDCHGTGLDGDGNFTNPNKHVNGQLDLEELDCDTCHGSDGNPAPPVDTQGNTATTARGVGAHQKHLGDSSWRAPIPCATCHQVPATVGTPGHADSPRPAELTFGGVAIEGEATPAFDGTSCSDVYCHGAALAIGGGSNTTPQWTRVDGSQAACGACHGIPPPAPHYPVSEPSCGPCHDFTGLQPDDPSTHVNGSVDVDLTCGNCHGIPPDTGAHRRHFAASTGGGEPPPAIAYGQLSTAVDLLDQPSAEYFFGCGNCHPTDASAHMNGTVDVELADPAASPESLKARNPATASFDGTRCSDVYCHSTATESPVFAQTPAWDGGHLPDPRCGACHSAPPESGGHVRHATGTTITYIRSREYACSLCHNETVAGADLATYEVADSRRHVNGRVDWAFDASDLRLNGSEVYSIPSGTVAPTDGSRAYGTCDEIYCHSVVQPDGGMGAPDSYTEPEWGTQTTCTGCHVPPSSGHSSPMLSGSHLVHEDYDLGSAGGITCPACHTYPPGPDPRTSCYVCHDFSGGGLQEQANHANGLVNVGSADAVGGAAASYDGTPSPGDGYGACNQGYCHSSGTSVRTGTIEPNVSPVWGTVASLACSACHGSASAAPPLDGMPAYPNGFPKENSHVLHAETHGIGCEICHSNTTTDGMSILLPRYHINGRYTLWASGTYGGQTVTFTYNAAGTSNPGSCISVNGSCHGTVGSAQTWGGP